MSYQNFYATKLQTSISSSDTSIDVQVPPTATEGRMVIDPRNSTQREIISYTGVAGSTLTGVTRGEQGTTAQAHSSGVLIEMNLTADDIQDIYDSFDSFVASNGNGWTALLAVPTITATNGNRSFDISFTGDKTSLLSKGMRLKFARTVTAPTQSTDLESGSSQYAVKTTPGGIGFSDDFTIEAWIKVESYPASGDANILSRYNGTNGFYMSLNTEGRVQIVGVASGVFEFGRALTAVPIGRWTHIAATLDLSGNASTIYIDGVSVGVSHTSGGFSTITQAGNLQIGAANGATGFFDGKIADVRLWSVVRTQAQVRDNMNQQLVGTETNLVGYWKLNGAFTDSTSNANDMTAQASAGFVTDNPFSSTVYAIITSAPAYGGVNTTMTIQTPEGYTVPNETLATAFFSTVKNPLGFPSDSSLWSITAPITTTISTTSALSETIYNSGIYVLVPVGSWHVSWKVPLNAAFGSAVTAVAQGGLSTTTSTVTLPELWFRSRVQSVANNRPNGFARSNLVYTTATQLNLLYGGAGGTATSVDVVGADVGNGYVKLECAYL